MLLCRIIILAMFSRSNLGLGKSFVLVFGFQKTADIALLCKRRNKSVAHRDDFHQHVLMIFRENIIHLMNFLVHFGPRVL